MGQWAIDFAAIDFLDRVCMHLDLDETISFLFETDSMQALRPCCRSSKLDALLVGISSYPGSIVHRLLAVNHTVQFENDSTQGAHSLSFSAHNRKLH